MNIALLVPAYIVWHYTRGVRDMVAIWENYMWFFYHLFSIPDLLKTLFAPWRRLGEQYPSGVHLEALFQVVLLNIMMRLVGAAIRLMFIFFGLLTLLAGVFVGAAFFALWLVLPLVCFFLLAAGFSSFVLLL